MRKVMVVGIRDGSKRTYNSMADAANDVGGQESHISECVRNVRHRNTHKGYIWMEADNHDTMGTTKN